MPRLSDFARVNRVEGLALGAGGSWHATPVLALGLLGRYGFADHGADRTRRGARGRFPSGRSLTLTAERTNRDAGDVAERSLVVNSLAAQEYGSDFTDPYLVRAAGARASALGAWREIRFTIARRLRGAERARVHAVPFNGSYAADARRPGR